ncbi:MAG TPA: tRNA-dihydrouridine synthase [Sulfurovum sp.]|nr:MAG: tRNA dihydrouridine synthase DusB [Sulfurovum sp. 35-42-20]OYY55645.1 MAG: tRNA dihydrouridine synthase DusB [Sulfurovum sp. 28-43-6]OYZ26590.1 MAG: tRNA dihydrouridine synthase DusB [Sulfurovum sp. 16-42-52]OYZ50677.1 MAG: tRNA dihydrouridine synthase DusB [Sulfurovum sp. 24-42-9]OZA47127.1 MAG: tRNA dihydrouridine synthase DusB [Sulfurovum sp. 17-42-90]OZA60778.1 MAG: tRNA dihydrouridine synthase DusB [Sulfurovum sp. 39-42-12]HQR74562.1 tRNA-dihydrouridine synthase [Sulfurovum sp.]
MATLDFSTPVYALAPLAGFTDLPFRSVVKKFGVDLTISEMISSNALMHQSAKTYRMLEKSPIENPYSIQIAGSDLGVIRRAVEIINEREDVTAIDLNCGCPAPKVVNNLQGSSLLTDLVQMGKVIETIKKYSNKEYTSVKFRLGFNEKNHEEIARICEESGADYIAVHGRTRAGRYKAAVDYDAIAQIKQSVSIPVLANGDIDSPAKAKWVLEHTRADGVMIGRAAVGKPWIFKQIKEGMDEPSSALIKEVVLEHFDQMIAHYDRYGAILFRKNLHSYSKVGYEGASAFRNEINRIEDVKAMRDAIEAFFTQEPLV